MKYFLIILTFFFVGTIFAAQETPAAASERSGGRFRHGGGRRGGNFMEQLKSKYPKETAEIEKLRSSDPEKARSKMRELMRKAGAEMRGAMRPGNFEPRPEQLDAIKAKYPEEFAEYEKLKGSDPEKARGKLHELMKKTFVDDFNGNVKMLRDRNRRAVEYTMLELKRRYPQEMQKIEEMRKTDPDGARRELRKLFAESNMRIPRGMNELNYEYVPANQQQNYRNGMMNRGFPFGGPRMMGPGGWGGRR